MMKIYAVFAIATMPFLKLKSFKSFARAMFKETLFIYADWYSLIYLNYCLKFEVGFMALKSRHSSNLNGSANVVLLS